MAIEYIVVQISRKRWIIVEGRKGSNGSHIRVTYPIPSLKLAFSIQRQLLLDNTSDYSADTEKYMCYDLC